MEAEGILWSSKQDPLFQDPKTFLDRSAGNKHYSRKKDSSEAIPGRNFDQNLLKTYDKTDAFEKVTRTHMKPCKMKIYFREMSKRHTFL